MTDRGSKQPPRPRKRDVLEAQRAPAGAAAAGEQPGKRTNDERNDPESEAGARSGLADTAPRAFTIVHDGDDADDGDVDDETGRPAGTS